MKMRSVAPMRVAKYGSIAASVAFCIIGGLFIVQPDASALWLQRLLGCVALGFGVIKLVGYFSRDLFRLAFQYDLESGILLLIMGIVVLLYPRNAREFLLSVLGIWAILDAMFKVRISADAKAFGISQWWVVRFLAIVTGTVGLSLLLFPREGTKALTVYLGMTLIAEGILNLSAVLSMVKISKKQYPDSIDASAFR